MGAPVLKALIDSKKFNITIVTRQDSKSTFPSSAKIVSADYTSVASLTSAFQSQDAVVATVGTDGQAGQSVLIDAAIAAGVKRFIPSEFGSDIGTAKGAALPVYGYKVATRRYLEAKVAAGADITYTYVLNGPFLDWGFQYNFLLDTKSTETKIYDGGKTAFSTTTLASVGQAVVGVLSHPEETRNRGVFVQDAVVTQKQLLELAKKALPGKEWRTVDVDTKDVERSSNEGLAKGEFTAEVMYGYLYIAVFRDGMANSFEKLDNELLGIKGMTDAEVEAAVKEVLEKN